MARPPEHLVGRPGLHDPPRVHDEDAVGDPGHDAEIVGDHKHAHAALRAQARDELEDLGLDGHVERGGRLVGDEQRRRARERDGDHRALTPPH